MLAGLESILGKRIVLITGKGGVGRSSVSAAIALAAARAGRRVLLTEIGETHDGDKLIHDYSPLARLFGRERLPENRELLLPGLWGALLLPLKGHELFLTSVFRVQAIAKAALKSEALRRLFQAAPSLREVGIFYSLLTYLREKREDGGNENELIVVDMPATGHTLALTGLPNILIKMVSRGPIADSLREGQSYLLDPAQSAAFVVTLPETLPVSETIELVEGLRGSELPVGGIILNHVPNDPFTPDERAALEAVLERSRADGVHWFGERGFSYYQQARLEAERLESEVKAPIIRLPDAPQGCDSLVAFLADSLIAHSAVIAENGDAEGEAVMSEERTLARVVEKARIIVCCGAGGVGKTTTSGALALAGARAGRRVLVLTIDPSRRLAEALGVEANPPAPVRLSGTRITAAGVREPGTLDAWMLDAKLVADEAVRRLVHNPEEVEKLLNNSIYRHVTTMVAGMHEYTAMQALHRFVLEGRYDLVVLDTPPSRHALDFLEAPSRLSRFLDGRVFRMFMPTTAPSGVRRFTGSLVNRVLGKVLGEQFAGDLSVFFGTFAGVLTTLSRDVTGMRKFLGAPDVAFLLITTPAPASLEEALFFQGKTHELGLPFRGFVLNRSAAAGAAARREPTAEAMRAAVGPGTFSEAALRALPKLQELARAEQQLIERDSKLLEDLTKRAGAEGFAAALPVIDPEGSEFSQLVELANAIRE